MRKITFGEPVLKVEGLETKFDVVPVSNSLAILIGDRDLATIVQQLSYWTLQGYGEVIDGVRWFYKPIAEWIEEVFPTFTPWKLGKMMKELENREIIRREKLFTKHQIQNGDRFWWQPKNQTYYYSLNTDKLQELADNFQVSKTAEPPETSVFIKTQILSNEEIKDTKDFDCAKNNTDITSIENNSKDLSHPHLPCEWSRKEKENSQDKQELSNPVLPEIQEADFANPKAIEQDTNVGQVEQEINQNKSTTPDIASVSKPKLKKTAKGTKQKRESKAPWKDEGQFKRFYRALIQALPIVANARSPQGLAQTIIRQLRSGIPHSYWDDFVAGLPIGTTDKPEWEVEPGVPYPMFIEYLTEKLRAGNNTKTDEQTRNEVFSILEKPRQAKAFWGQFKRSVVNVSEQVERDRSLGVSNPNTPVWTRERIEPSVEEAAAAGEKIMAVNGGDRAISEGVSKTLAQTEPLQIESTHRTSDKQELPPPDPWTDSEVSRRDTASIYPFRDKSSSEPEPSSEEDKPESKPRLSMREMLARKGVKGFCKPIPKVSDAEIKAEERKQIKPKTNIANMAIAEINEYLTDPILRAQLTPQLYQSNYELITDELGQIIAVKLSDLQKRERQSQSLGE